MRCTILSRNSRWQVKTARKIAIGGRRARNDRQVRSGDRLRGIQPGAMLASSRASVAWSRPGRPVQMAGGSGISCMRGTAARRPTTERASRWRERTSDRLNTTDPAATSKGRADSSTRARRNSCRRLAPPNRNANARRTTAEITTAFHRLRSNPGIECRLRLRGPSLWKSGRTRPRWWCDGRSGNPQAQGAAFCSLAQGPRK